MNAEEIEQELREALAHLYDPAYRPSERLCKMMGCETRDGTLFVQTTIIQAIEDFKSLENTPASSRVKQIYDLLRNRFVLKLTLEETAERMHTSYSSTWRAQRSAVHALARSIWERSQARQSSAEDRARVAEERPPGEEALDNQAVDWRSQTKRELASLQAITPNAVCDVGDVINSVLELETALMAKRGVHVEVRFVQPNLVATIHPSVLRQILITALGRLALYTSSGQITLFAGLEDGNVKVTLIGSIAAESRPIESDLISDVLVLEDASIEAHIEGEHIFLWVELPSVGKVTVLAVDDNPDLAEFYRRSVEGTSYHIVHTAEGQGLFEIIEATAPDIIVLDVILPDIDGWEVLMRLHQDPGTRSIPVIVCSVVREEELALSLGAARCLFKPVQPREFIQTLDQVLAQAPTGAPRDPTNSETAC